MTDVEKMAADIPLDAAREAWRRHELVQEQRREAIAARAGLALRRPFPRTGG